MTISIVIPSLNQGRYLEETLSSVIAQRGDAHEILVYDGGSTDGSVNIIKRYSRWIDHWQSKPDGGQTAALIDGFNSASGEILYWVNSDDVLLPGALSRVRRAFDENPEWDVTKGYAVMIDAYGRILRTRRDPADTAFWAWWGVLDVIQPSTFFRRSAYEAVGGLDVTYNCAMDTDLWYRFLLSRAKWGALPAYLSAARLHSEAKAVVLKGVYREERKRMRSSYPKYAAKNARDLLGHPLLYAANIGSGKALRTFADNRRFLGRHYREIFGEFSDPEGAVEQ